MCVLRGRGVGRGGDGRAARAAAGAGRGGQLRHAPPAAGRAANAALLTPRCPPLPQAAASLAGKRKAAGPPPPRGEDEELALALAMSAEARGGARARARGLCLGSSCCRDRGAWRPAPRALPRERPAQGFAAGAAGAPPRRRPPAPRARPRPQEAKGGGGSGAAPAAAAAAEEEDEEAEEARIWAAVAEMRTREDAAAEAQQRVVAEIARDLEQGRPMQRLVQGDVGAGKTVVAALAALQAVEADHQVALMAPTELLAEQHLRNFQTWLEPLGVELTWLTGRQKGKSRAARLDALADGSVRVAVGTHALFQQDVRFRSLGLVIIDEQHRFGVHQRLALREKGRQGERMPHQLIMTATPIPRTLAMTAYADLDLSVIDQLPPGRIPVTTVALPDSRRPEVIERIRGACAGGRQAYWVCTLIEESEALQCQAAEDTAALLSDSLEGLRVGLVHGRMKAARQGGRDGRVQGRRDRSAGGHHGDRGRGGCAQRQPDGDREPGAPWAGPAPPVARSGGPWE